MHILFVPVKASFFWKGVQQSSFIIEMMIQKKLKVFLEHFKQDRYIDETNKKSGNNCK